MMVLMAFKKQERANLWCYVFCEALLHSENYPKSLRTTNTQDAGEHWWGHHGIQTKVATGSSAKRPSATAMLWTCAFLLLLPCSAFGCEGGRFTLHARLHKMGFVFPCRHVGKLPWRGLCLTAGHSGYPALWQRSPRPKSDPVAWQSGSPHWQPRVVTAPVGWHGAPLAHREKWASVLIWQSLGRKKALRPWKILEQHMAPIMGIWTLLPVSQGGPSLGKRILAFPEWAHYLVCPSSRRAWIRTRFHKPVSCETRLLIRVNYSVLEGNNTMEQKQISASRGGKGLRTQRRGSTALLHALNVERELRREFCKQGKWPLLSCKRRCSSQHHLSSGNSCSPRKKNVGRRWQHPGASMLLPPVDTPMSTLMG